jgi:hypothetical protein
MIDGHFTLWVISQTVLNWLASKLCLSLAQLCFQNLSKIQESKVEYVPDSKMLATLKFT